MKFNIAAQVSGATVYAVFIRQGSGLYWNGTALETFAGASFGTYDVATAELGTSKVYQGDVPDGLPSGRYDVIGYYQGGASPDMTDVIAGSSTIDYGGSGSVVVGSPLGTMTGAEFYAYLLRGGFVRPDQEQAVYDHLTDTILEIEQLYEFDEREEESTLTDTITVLGDYKMNVEADMGLLLGVTLIDGNFSRALNKRSKRWFDEKYPNPAADVAEGRPKDFCLFAGQLYVGPRPDSVSYQYRMDFSRRLTTSIDSTTSIPYSAQYREVLKDGTLWRLFENFKNFEEANRFLPKYQGGLQRIINKERRNKTGFGCVEYHGV